MRHRLLAAVALAALAAPALAISFAPGYWQRTLSTQDGHAIDTVKGCLPKVDTQFSFSPIQKRYCKRLHYSVAHNTITSKIRCDYPTVSRTSYESVTFAGDTLRGVVRIEETKPLKQTVVLVVTGKRLSASCPKSPVPGTH